MNLRRRATTTSIATNPMRHPPLWRAFVVIPLLLVCFGLLPSALATDTESALAGNNTADGSGVLVSPSLTGFDNSGFGFQALRNDTTGSANTAIGFDALLDNTTGSANTAIGFDALLHNSTGGDNTATGFQALLLNSTGTNNTANGFKALLGNTTGRDNTAVGSSALSTNTTGGGNTATGFQALLSNTTGNFNTATGLSALFSNTSGSANTATGEDALGSNTTGSDNTAAGDGALFSNTTGRSNTATGVAALLDNTTGGFNTATGSTALASNTTGEVNTATGEGALSENTTGNANTATGSNALSDNINGINNTATGFHALLTNTAGSNNTADGFQALQNSTGDSNIAIGSGAGSNLTAGSNNIYLAALGTNESNTIRIGRLGVQTQAFIQGINGVSVTGSAVQVNSSGRLGVTTSSGRFKDEIKPMGRSSEAILALKPVTFRYKQEIDPERLRQFGLVAEEVEKVDPALITRDADGRAYTVRYDAVNAMLLNEFLKEHRKNQEQEATITALTANDAKQEATIAQQQKQIDALSAALQKVSAQLATANGAAGMRSDIDGSSRQTDMSGSELVNPSSGGLEVSTAASQTVLNNQ